ncbi:MAG TPA: hypothetical protein VIM14_19195 [Polyangia bacterium]
MRRGRVSEAAPEGGVTERHEDARPPQGSEFDPVWQEDRRRIALVNERCSWQWRTAMVFLSPEGLRV